MDKLSLQVSLELCEWLWDHEVGLESAAHIITDLELGDSFGLAVLKMFKRNQNKRYYAKIDDCSNSSNCD